MKFAKNSEEDFSLQLTPLIDVVFLLLIFFMVSTVFKDFSRQLDIELPEMSAGKSPADIKTVTIEVNGEGSIFLDGEPVAIENLSGRLSEIIGKRAPREGARSVVIRADKTISYGAAVRIMDICRNAGIEDIGLTVLPK
jgi:biopolymer transport protein ExbD